MAPLTKDTSDSYAYTAPPVPSADETAVFCSKTEASTVREERISMEDPPPFVSASVLADLILAVTEAGK